MAVDIGDYQLLRGQAFEFAKKSRTSLASTRGFEGLRSKERTDREEEYCEKG